MALRLTKKRLQALEHQLSFDDILFEKFRRLREELAWQEMRLAKKKHVVRVYRETGTGVLEAMQLVDLYVTEEGTIVNVR